MAHMERLPLLVLHQVRMRRTDLLLAAVQQLLPELLQEAMWELSAQEVAKTAALLAETYLLNLAPVAHLALLAKLLL